MDILGIAGGAVTCLGALLATLGWFYKRGGDERELTVAMRENTKVTGELSGKLDRMGGVLNDHEVRLSVLESKD
jgi:hypothetical protein